MGYARSDPLGKESTLFGGRAWKIATIGGIPVRVDSSWLFIAAFIVYSLFTQYVNGLGIDQSRALPLALFTAALFFGSILLHELAHAGIARLRDVQVSSITLYFFGGATATNLDKRPGDQFLISAAGPGMSLLIGALFWSISRATQGSLTSVAFGYVGWISLLLAVFNVLPGYPLDGGQMLRAGVWRITGNELTATKVAAISGFVVGGLLAGLGVISLARGDLGGGIWLGVIGYFLIQNAQAATRRAAVRAALVGGTAEQAMGPPPAAVPAPMSLSDVLERYLRGHEQEAFPVVEGSRAIGLLTFESASRVGRHDPLRPARDAMMPLEQVATVDPETPLEEVVRQLGPTGAALVLRNGELAGAITAGDIERWATANKVR
ncbi:MAG: site-2 protease family protein [Actinomycetota bacterium]|nr:site-2 protease family protein [Actinomycetota bacterium]